MESRDTDVYVLLETGKIWLLPRRSSSTQSACLPDLREGLESLTTYAGCVRQIARSEPGNDHADR